MTGRRRDIRPPDQITPVTPTTMSVVKVLLILCTNIGKLGLTGLTVLLFQLLAIGRAGLNTMQCPPFLRNLTFIRGIYLTCSLPRRKCRF